MHDYQRFALMLGPVEEKDLILFDMSPDDKVHVVKQYNRALLNAQRDGTDVAQIILKPLIEKYPSWGDCALLYGLCLAREKQFKRAESAMEYAVNNTLSSEQSLAIAQESMKLIRDDIKNPDPEPEVPKSNKTWTSLASGEAGAAGRKGMQAPILVKATNRTNDFQMASEKERRDIMMRSAAVGDEMASDDIIVEDVRTPADRLRFTVKVITGIVIAVAVFLLVFLVIIPAISKMKNSHDTEDRLDFLIAELEENKDDPAVAGIINDYAVRFEGAEAVDSAREEAAETTTTTETTTEETTTTTEETELAPVINTAENEPEETSEGEGEGESGDGGDTEGGSGEEDSGDDEYNE